MPNRLSLVTIFVISIYITACSGSGDGITNNSASFTDSYSFTYNGCATGEQKFSASSQNELLENLCAGLLDDSRNNSCAKEMRDKEFKSKCMATQVAKNLTPATSTSSYSRSQLGGNYNPVEKASQAEEDVYKKVFEEKPFVGLNKWLPSKASVTFDGIKKGDKTTLKWEKECSFSRAVELEANYPSLRFSIGRVECGDYLLSTVTQMNFLLTHLIYDIRHIDSSPRSQFLLSLNFPMTRINYLPSGYKVTEKKSLNSVIYEKDIAIDFVYEIRESYVTFSTDYYYINIKLNSNNEKNLTTLEISMDIDNRDVDGELELKANLKQ